MTKPFVDIQFMLTQLEASLPALLLVSDDFRDRFAERAREVEQAAHLEDLPYVRFRIERMLADRGLSKVLDEDESPA